MKFLAIFYLVGLIGFAVPVTRDFFRQIIPLSLLLVFVMMFFYHHKWETKLIVALIFTALTGFAAEAAGVQTGMIFGNYHYTGILGPKILQTPLLIGFNWAALIYCVLAVAQKTKLPVILQVFIASLLMVLYDIALEPFAVKTGMWVWENNTVPLQNYFAWFALSFILTTIWVFSGIKVKNRPAVLLFFLQILFFLIKI